jgi:probable blue pigment (indigoidine) exporter
LLGLGGIRVTKSATEEAVLPAASPIRVSRTDLLLLIVLGVLWGSAYVAIREGIVAGASPLIFAGTRYAIVAALFAAVAVARNEPWPGRRAALLSAGVGGTLIIGIYGGLLYWGEQYTTGGYASVLAGTAPILTVVFAHALLPSERLRPAAIAGIVVGFVGVVVLVLPALLVGVGNDWEGPVAVMAAFVVFPIGTVLLRRWGRSGEGTWQLSLQFGVGAAILGLAILLLPVPEALPLTFSVWAWLLVLVVFASMCGYVVYFRLHHRIGPGRANLVAYIVPLVGVGLGSGLFGEPITVWEVGGFLLVAAGLTLVFATGDLSRRASAGASPQPESPSTLQSKP